MKFNQYVSFLIESERKFPRLMVFEIKVKLIDVGLNKADVDQFTKRIMTADATQKFTKAANTEVNKTKEKIFDGTNRATGWLADCENKTTEKTMRDGYAQYSVSASVQKQKDLDRLLEYLNKNYKEYDVTGDSEI